MKKLLSVLLATVLLLSCVPLGAASVSAASAEAVPAAAEDLAAIFQDNLDFLDQYYTLDAEFMIHKLCGILYPWEEAEANGYAPIPTPAAEFEAVLNRYFAPTEQQMADIRNYPIWDNDIGGTRPFYDADTGNYLVFFLGGFGGSMPEREYQRYIQTETGYTVFYQHVTYDVLEITESLYVELEALGWPATYTHNGYVYENGPDGYLRVASRDDYGYQYEVQYQDGFLRILSQTPYTAAPESDFEYEIEDGEATVTGYVGNGGDVIIPSTLGGYPVTAIGEWAINCCHDLTSVIIPDSVTSIYFSAFSNCTSLNSIDVSPNNSKYCSLDGVLFSKDKTNLVKYPGGKSGAYTIPDSTTRIGLMAFKGCTNLTSVVIPNTIARINHDAFNDCTSLISITIPDSVTSIGESVFSDCDSLTDVYYTGTEEQGQSIEISTGNNILLNATWHYNSCIGKTEHTYKAATCTAPKTCKICGVTSGKKLGHTYDNACDKSCNRCKATRTIKHDYKAATCTKAKTCKVCGVTSGKALGHKYTNSCDTTCNTCKATRKITHSYKTVTKKATTTANGYTVKRCSVCKKETGKTTIYKASKISLSKTTYTYNGKAQKPTVTVKDSKGNKIASSNYTITYASGRKNVGTYKVTIKFKGKYSGTKTLTYKINPVKTTVSKLTAAKKSLKVTITKKATQVTGYEVQYATNKNFKSAKTKTLTSYKKNTLTLTGLKAKTTYYVRVRTYKTVNGKKYYSGWSTVKTVKTK